MTLVPRSYPPTTTEVGENNKIISNHPKDITNMYTLGLQRVKFIDNAARDKFLVEFKFNTPPILVKDSSNVRYNYYRYNSGTKPLYMTTLANLITGQHPNPKLKVAFDPTDEHAQPYSHEMSLYGTLEQLNKAKKFLLTQNISPTDVGVPTKMLVSAAAAKTTAKKTRAVPRSNSYESSTKATLLGLAKTRGIKGRHCMNKATLIAALRK